MTLNRQYKITPVALKKMKEHLMGAYPLEGCGILVGDEGGSIEEVFGTKNAVTAENAAGYYEIEPLEMYELERKAEEKDYNILGFYHSHPDCDARMSSEESGSCLSRVSVLVPSDGLVHVVT